MHFHGQSFDVAEPVHSAFDGNPVQGVQDDAPPVEYVPAAQVFGQAVDALVP